MKSRTPVAVVVAAAVILIATLAAPSSAKTHHHPGRGRIVFGAETTNGTQLWTIWPNGTHLRQVTHVDGDAVNPDWSPDGRLLTFEWDTEEAAMVAVMNADGSALRSLGQTGCEFEGQPVFSADQRRIIYERYDCDVDDSLFSQQVKGGDERRLTDAFPDGHTDPNVSPNGRYLSFIRFDGGVEFQQALTVARANGTGQRDLLPPSWDIAIKHAWSPDNCHPVFTRDADPDPVTGILERQPGDRLARRPRPDAHRISAVARSARSPARTRRTGDGSSIGSRTTTPASPPSTSSGRTAAATTRSSPSEGVRARFIDWG